jgi:hypothetical protein
LVQPSVFAFRQRQRGNRHYPRNGEVTRMRSDRSSGDAPLGRANQKECWK